MRGVRVLHVAECFGGGLMEAAIIMAEEAARRGNEVAIAYGVRPETPADLHDLVDPIVELREMPWRQRTAATQFRASRELRTVVADWQPDIVQLHSSFAGAVGAAALRGGPPTILCPQGFASAVPEGGAARRRAYRAIERAMCRNVTMVGAVSHSEAALARSYGARRVVRIPNGIRELDADRVVTRVGGSGEPPTVVASGRTVPQSQPAACARILAAVREIAEPLWLGGGNGSRGEPGRRALAMAGIPLSGWLARDELMRRIEDATVYLHWTAWDGLSLSVLEALALDVVVVASDIPPNREILGAEGVCATEEKAVARICRIISDPDFAEEQRERQRARRGEFSAEEMVEGWLDAYAELLGRTREPRLVPAPAVV